MPILSYDEHHLPNAAHSLADMPAPRLRPPQVTGSVKPILSYDEGTKLAFAFEGVDPLCADGRGDSAISCGMHIHQGTSCDEAAGGLLFADGIDNPWLDVHYTATPDGRASGMASIATGLSTVDVLGRVLAIHDHAGTAIACSIITEMPAVAHATGFVPYAGYAGSLTTADGGAYPIVSDGTTTKFTYDVIGADPLCKDGPAEGVGVSCGLHLHVGTTCEEMAGDLFFAGETNPWLAVSYTTQGGDGCTAESVVSDPASCYLTGELETVATGLTADEIVGKVFILHDVQGVPYACATVAPDIGRAPLYATGFVPYYNYDTAAEGALSVSGVVSPVVTQAVGVSNSAVVLKGMPAQSFSYELSGVDPACADGATDAPNSCGIHVHAGTSCDTDALGHYYAPAAGSDPWVNVVYTTTPDGKATGTVTGVLTGYPAAEMVGHAVLIHDRTGARVACAILAEGTPADCPEGCLPAAAMARRNLLFSTMPNCPVGCEPVM
jgi:hypothetical protein